MEEEEKADLIKWQILQETINEFRHELETVYRSKFPEHGHSWIDCTLEELKTHLRDHIFHTLDSRMENFDLVGIALLCMMIRARRKDFPTQFLEKAKSLIDLVTSGDEVF